MGEGGTGLPTISLPKGGGAIRGAEKLSTNAATGSGTVAIPIPAAPGRSGFELQLQLSYDSGAGNGPFGLGWQLSIPQIARKTDKGLPRYGDADVFVLSGAEDLVPVGQPVIRGDHEVRAFRPRIETAFSRIERWTHRATTAAHWRVTTRDNALSIFGRTDGARVADPDDPTRVFAWLLEETRDDRGNVVRYGYKSEDAAGVDRTRPSEASRFMQRDGSTRFHATAQRYLKRIQYGNAAPVLDRDAPAPESDDAWLFEIAFDYGEHDPLAPAPHDSGAWTLRPDAFSSHRAGFDVRTYRLCRRILMFHRFPTLGPTACLVRSLDLTYDEGPIVSYLASITQVAYQRPDPAVDAYTRASWPSIDLGYARPELHDELRSLDRGSLDGVPAGVAPPGAQWVDLDGEGIPGILIPTARAWFYKANLGDGQLGPPVVQRRLPAPAELRGAQQLVDVGGDGNLDLVAHAPPMAGYFERTADRDWLPFVPFQSAAHLDWNDPNLRFVDLDGDGFPDILITQQDQLVWYRSLGRRGFELAAILPRPADELRGPAIVFAGSEETIQLADMSGDGLADIVRIRNGEVCYWPNLGHGRFGARVTLDRSPQFDAPDRFDPRRIRLADIDGSGTADLVYLGRDGVAIYLNESGNSLAPARRIASISIADISASISVVDLLGTGTACLVVSSDLPGDQVRPVAYVDLMGGRKPHLLTAIANNLGVETRITYEPSTRFYLADKQAGRPWLTRLPFPVHVVSRVEVRDRISGNTFVTRHAYHDGHYDGEEREFRGFGMVEQWDTEDFALLSDDGSSTPPVRTKTWFHTGAELDGGLVARACYREPGMTDADAAALRLADPALPAELTAVERREAMRALKGVVVRQETYADDGTPLAAFPYTVAEHSFEVACLQRRGDNLHAVFSTHVRESVSYAYERSAADPRISHTLVLAVDEFGNVLESASIGYGRREPQADPSLALEDRDVQRTTLVTYAEHAVTNAIADDTAYRTPAPAETRVYELTGYAATGPAGRFTAADLVAPARELDLADDPSAGRERRLVGHQRILYRADDLSTLLPLGVLHGRALTGESYKLAFTPALLAQVYQRPRDGGAPENLISDPAAIARDAGYRLGRELQTSGLFPATDDPDRWWIPSGRAYCSPGTDDTPAQELVFAQRHFFLPVRHRDAFHTAEVSTEHAIAYDAFDLLVVAARDPLGNAIAATNDYRVLQPTRVVDPNGNRSAVAFDLRGLVVGTAAMGPAGTVLGDSLDGFDANPGEATVLAHLADPLVDPHSLLGPATTRLVYDLFAYARTRASAAPQPMAVYTLVRETHGAAPGVQHSFSYSDGLGREIQKKLQAEAGRWVGSGWTIFNNKGNPVRQYEPFFTATHHFERDRAIGVSSIRFYDPVGRSIATVRPDATYEKVVISAWRQASWDVNDTVLLDPRTDPDLGGRFRPDDPQWMTWYQQRSTGALGPREQEAARRAAAHGATPMVGQLDSLGRQFVTLAHAGFAADGAAITIPTRVALDITGKERSVRDALGRTVMRYRHDAAGSRIAQVSMEAGARWTLGDVAGKPVRSWDSRGHAFRSEFDPLRRPIRSFAAGVAPGELLVERLIYGEQHPEAQRRNLRGALYLHLDQAGMVTDEERDFKGNRLRDTRRLAIEYKTALDWSAVDAVVPARATAVLDLTALATALAPKLEAETFASRTAYDALNRAIQIVPPRSTEAGAARHVVQPVYNEANLLEQLHVWLDHPVDPPDLLDPAVVPPSPVGVANLDYDAKGQCVLAAYKNGASTAYRHDPQTFRLSQLTTRAASDALQDLAYTYDPAGNVVRIDDGAQQTIYFRNRRVDPSNEYTYDPLYRLITATGREHLGQVGGSPAPYSYDDIPRVGQPHPNDGNAMGRYVENYAYDAAGNLQSMQHVGLDPASPGWTRTFAYDEASQLEPTSHGNRLTSTTVAGTTEVYSTAGDGYDAHGNLQRMPHLQVMQWDLRDQLQMTQRQAVNAQDADGALHQAERTWYVYDAAGTRIRKVTESAQGQRREERIYLGGFELRRQTGATDIVVETLHVVDGGKRIAMVETRVQGDDADIPKQRIRYQHANHVGSSVLELDETARILSYEEFTSFGSTSYAATPGQTGARKRYRFLGRERDEESGLISFGLRYYVPWLGRWTTPDRAGLSGGINLFVYCSNNPVCRVDPRGSADELAVNESNLIYDFDHYSPQSKYGTLSNKASNLGFLMADENRRKGAAEFSKLPAMRDPISLERAFREGPDATRKAVGEMLGGRRFSEVKELNELWQRASKNETLSYDTAQGTFRRLIATGEDSAARSVRQAFAHAGVDIIPNGQSFRFRLDDTPYRKPAGSRTRIPGGKGGAVLAIVGAVAGLLSAGTAAAAVPDAPAAPPQDEPAGLASQLRARIHVASELSGVVDAAPGGALATFGLLGVQVDAVLKLKALEFAELNNLRDFGGRLSMIENAPFMVDPASGALYEINMNSLSNAGQLTPVTKLNRTAWGWYYDKKNVVSPENGKLYLRQW